jgi:hypothetical protein
LLLVCINQQKAIQRQKYFIKGMVCERCIGSVKEAPTNMHLTGIEVILGEVSFNADAQIKESTIEERLNALGFELLEDKKIQLVKQIKSLIDEVYSGNFEFPYISVFCICFRKIEKQSHCHQ